MAEGKKSFVLYSDYKDVFSELSDKDAGQLIKHIFKYVNDENPVTENPLVKLSFIPIKNQLKRDLKDWENIREKRSEAGKLGGRPKNQTEAKEANAFSEKQTEAKKAVTVTVNDTVTDNVKIERETRHENQFVIYDCEKEILKNQIEFERICAGAGKNLTEGAEILHNYHLYLEEKDQYPKGRKAAFSGFERWITNEKKFNKNGHSATTTSGKHKGAMQLVSSLKQDFAARRKENT